jgi:hypothetical protein
LQQYEVLFSNLPNEIPHTEKSVSWEIKMKHWR